MQRIKFIKDNERNKAGDIVVVDNNVAHRLIEEGIAMISKDMTPRDYKTSKIPVSKRGRTQKWQL